MKIKKSISIDRDVMEAIEEEAKKQNRSVSNYIEFVINQYWIVEEEKYIKLI